MPSMLSDYQLNVLRALREYELNIDPPPRCAIAIELEQAVYRNAPPAPYSQGRTSTIGRALAQLVYHGYAIAKYKGHHTSSGGRRYLLTHPLPEYATR